MLVESGAVRVPAPALEEGKRLWQLVRKGHWGTWVTGIPVSWNHLENLD